MAFSTPGQKNLSGTVISWDQCLGGGDVGDGEVGGVSRLAYFRPI